MVAVMPLLGDCVGASAKDRILCLHLIVCSRHEQDHMSVPCQVSLHAVEQTVLGCLHTVPSKRFNTQNFQV